MIRALSLCAMTLAATPTLAEDSVSPETLAMFKKIEQAVAVVACQIGATDPDAADQALTESGFARSEDEGSWNYASGNLTVMMWTVPGFCMVEDSEAGTEAMAANFLNYLSEPPQIGKDAEGCTTYLLSNGVTATLNGPGNDPQCTSDTGAALRFSLPN
jgi:hypothetical protein